MKKIGLIIVTLLVSSKLPAQNLRDPEFMKQARTGFEDIYNMDYVKAKRLFLSLEKQYPYHPAPPLYLASISWVEELIRRQDLDLNRFVSASYFSRKTDLKMPAGERDAFFKNLQQSQSLIDVILSKNPQDKDGRYFQATLDGLRAAFAITIDHGFREAFRYGNKAYDLCSGLIEEDPEYYDAYLGVGVYQYIAGSIPWYLKWMAFVIGIHGNKEDGMKHVELTSERGQYNKDEAKLIEMVMLVREKRYPEALAVSRSLSERFPKSYLFPINVAQIMDWAGQKDAAAQVLLDVLKRAETGEPNFDRLPLQKFRYSVAVELMNYGRWDLAREQFVKSIDDPLTRERERALSHLYLGRIFQEKGEHAKAAREFQAVLALGDFEDSHKRARHYLKNL